MKKELSQNVNNPEDVMASKEEIIGEALLRFEALDNGVLKEGWIDIIDNRDNINIIGQVQCRVEYVHSEVRKNKKIMFFLPFENEIIIYLFY